MAVPTGERLEENQGSQVEGEGGVGSGAQLVQQTLQVGALLLPAERRGHGQILQVSEASQSQHYRNRKL